MENVYKFLKGFKVGVFLGLIWTITKFIILTICILIMS